MLDSYHHYRSMIEAMPVSELIEHGFIAYGIHESRKNACKATRIFADPDLEREIGFMLGWVSNRREFITNHLGHRCLIVVVPQDAFKRQVYLATLRKKPDAQQR